MPSVGRGCITQQILSVCQLPESVVGSGNISEAQDSHGTCPHGTDTVAGNVVNNLKL